jgi:peptidyl-prolyl cis-trans isomerase A (cyclophilin A)
MKPVLLTIALTGALSGVLLSQTKSDAPKVAPKAPSAAATKAPAPAAAAANLLTPATLNRTAPATFRVKLTTTKGDVVIDVTRDWAPRGADRFYNLVRAGYFTDASFFRVVPNFMAQFGISARPDVNRAWTNANIQDDPGGKKSNTRGMVTFATTGRPNTRGTQLFINTAMAGNAFLDPMGFVPFGEVVEGMENVDKFYTGYGDTANQEGVIEEGGKAWVDKNMPKLDRILTATIVPPAAAPGAAPAAPKQAAPKQ